MPLVPPTHVHAFKGGPLVPIPGNEEWIDATCCICNQSLLPGTDFERCDPHPDAPDAPGGVAHRGCWIE